MAKPRSLAFVFRHWKAFIASGVILGAASGAGYKAIADARAERVLSVPAADVSLLRQDIGDLRDDIREERRARGELTKQIGEVNTRLGRLEGAEAAKRRK